MIDRAKVLKATEGRGTREAWRESFTWPRRNHTTKLRIFEYLDKDGDIVFAHSFTEHYLPSRLPTGPCVCRKEMFKSPCVFCTINKQVPSGVSYIPFPLRRSFIINAMDTEDIVERIKQYLVPYTVFNEISSYVRKERLQDILEFDSCRIFAIKSVGEGLEKRYITKLMVEKARPLLKKFKKQIVRLHRMTRDPGFEAQLQLLNDYLRSESKKI